MRAYHENMQHNQIPLRATSAEGFLILAHWHNEVEILYVTSGTYNIGINDESRVLREGEFVIASSDDIHYFDAPPSSTHVLLILRPDFIGCLGGWPQEVRFRTPFITQEILADVPSDALARMDKIFRTLPDEFNEKGPHFEAYIKGLLYELTALMLRHLPTVPLDKKLKSRHLNKTKTLQTILDFLEQNYKNDVNLDDLATQLHISPFHLARVFRTITGMNFKTFINNFRLEKADQLLHSTRDSITKVAFSCGFGSVRTFNRVYKANKGHPPTK